MAVNTPKKSVPVHLSVLIGSLATFSGLFLIFLIFLNKRTGVHVDEMTYFLWSQENKFGDFSTTGKPVLYWLTNYYIVQLLSWIGINASSFGLFSIYAFLISLSAWLLASQLSQNIKQKVILFLLIILSPYCIFTGSQLMMESALMIMLNLIFLALLSSNSAGRTILLFLSTAVAVAIKVTVVPAILLLILASALSVKHKDRRSIIIFCITTFIGSAAGYISHKIFSYYHPHTIQDYGSLKLLISSEHLNARLQQISHYLMATLFFLGPLLFLLFGKLRQNFRLYFLMAIVVVVVCMIALASRDSFFRYCGPLVWAGFLILTLQYANNLSRFAVFIAILSLLWSACVTAMIVSPWKLNQNSFPQVISDELHNNGYTIFPGMPVYLWAWETKAWRKSYCALVPEEQGFRTSLLISWLRSQSRNVSTIQFAEDFSTCRGKKIVLRRQTLPEADVCASECYASKHHTIQCETQNLRLGQSGDNDVVINKVCLPL